MRIIVSESLSEDALYALVEIMEDSIAESLAIEAPASNIAQPVLYQGKLSLIVTYDDAAVADALLALDGARATVRDPDREGTVVDKDVAYEVVAFGDEASSSLAMHAASAAGAVRPPRQTLLLQREWGPCSFSGSDGEALLRAFVC